MVWSRWLVVLMSCLKLVSREDVSHDVLVARWMPIAESIMELVKLICLKDGKCDEWELSVAWSIVCEVVQAGLAAR